MGELVVLAVESEWHADQRFELLLEWRRIGEAMSPVDLACAVAEMRRTLRGRVEPAVLCSRENSHRCGR